MEDRFTACAPAEKFIEIKVKARIVPATGTTAEKRFWVWVMDESFLTVNQIHLPAEDASFRETIRQALESLKAEIVGDPPDPLAEIGVGRGGDQAAPAQFETQLVSKLDSSLNFQAIPAEGLTQAPLDSDRDQIFTARICISYVLPRLPVGAEINIKTQNGESAPLSDIRSFTLADTNEAFRGQPQGEIPVRLAYAQKDLDDAHRDKGVTDDAAARRSVETDLLKVAATSFAKAVDKGLLAANGSPLVGQAGGRDIAANVENEIVGAYSLNSLDPKVQWSVVKSRVMLRDTTPAAPWIISVTGLQLAQTVDIEVLKSPIESEFDGSIAEKKFDQKRKKVQDDLRAKHLASFTARPGHLITSTDIDHDRAILLNDKDSVKSVGDITSGATPPVGTQPPQKLIYAVSRHLKAEKDLNLKLGGGYSPEDHLTGSLVVETVNMLGFSETAKLDYSGGPQVQKIRFNFDRPFENVETLGWHFKILSVKIQYFADKDKRFGNLTKQEIEDRETGSEARLSFGYDSFSILDHAALDCLADAKRKRTRYYLLATPVFGYRDVNIKEDNALIKVTQIDKALLPQARTQTTTLSLDANLGFSHDFRQPGKAGVGMFNMSLNGRLLRGFRLFGADYKYNKVYATLTSEMFLGFISSRDFFLRHNHVIGRGTHGTPIFELFSLGGPQAVRGLEDGEIIGRKMSVDQVEFGINSMVLWHLITRKPVAEALLKDNCPDSPEETRSKLPFDINNTYLKVFYDYGRVHDRDSFVIPGGVSRTARGYGVAFELRQLGGKNINLSFGYAHSPESTLHKSGTLYTGVSYTR